MGKNSTSPDARRVRPPQRRRPPRLQAALPKLQAIDYKRDCAALGLLFISVLVLYAAATPRTVMLEDDGLLITAAVSAGVAHPPGYPLFTILGWLAAHIPLGSIAWRVHMVSGVMGAITCTCIAWLILRRVGSRPGAYIAGAILGVSEHYWSQAIIADVYTTNTALLFLTVALVQESAAKNDTRLWIVAAVLYGLGLANHWPLLILGSPLLLAYIIVARKDIGFKLIWLPFLSIGVAMLFYGWMAWRSHQSPYINFLGPIQSLDELIAYVRRDFYAGLHSSPNADWSDKWLYTQHFITKFLLEFTPIGAIIAGFGAVGYYHNWRLGAISEGLALIGSSLALIALLDIDYVSINIGTFRPYTLVAYCILALWMGSGIDLLLRKTGDHRRYLRSLMCMLFALIIAALGMWNSRTNYAPHNTFAAEQAQVLLDLVEKNAILVVSGDTNVFPVAYLHRVEGKRPDVRLLELKGLILNDRLFDPLREKGKRSHVWQELLATSERPIYFLAIHNLSGVGQTHLGFVKKVTNSQANQINLGVSQRAKDFFRATLQMEVANNRWMAAKKNKIIETYGEYLGLAQLINNPLINQHIADVLSLAMNNYWSLISMSGTLLSLGKSEQHLAMAESWLSKAKQFPDPLRGKKDRAIVPYLEGVIAQKKGFLGKAKALFHQSIAINRRADNQSYKALQRLSVAK